jgi:hypothetical protein
MKTAREKNYQYLAALLREELAGVLTVDVPSYIHLSYNAVDVGNCNPCET